MKGVLVGLALLAGVIAADASPILVPTVSPDATGFSYAYTLDTDTPAQHIGMLVIAGLSSYDELTVTWPVGWLPSFPLEPDIIVWSAIDPAAVATFGSPVSGFSFHSVDAPGEGTFITLFDEEDETGSLLGFGTTLVPAVDTPVAVPEPASLSLLLSGLIVAARRSRAESRRRRSAHRHCFHHADG